MTKPTSAAFAALILATGCLGCRSSTPVAQTASTGTVLGQRAPDKPIHMNTMHLPPGARPIR